VAEQAPPAGGDGFAAFVSELGSLRRQAAGRGPESMVVLAQTESTNTLGKAIADSYENEGIDLLAPILLLAYEQTGGRGRRGRTWASPAGGGVYATLVLPVGDVRQLMTLPLLVGVGLCRALSAHLPRPCLLKWPNDLLIESPDAALGRRKIGGILIESLVRRGEPVVALIGFGVNRLEHQGLPPHATSVTGEGGDGGSLAALTWDLVSGVDHELAHLGNAPYAIDSYRHLSIHRIGEQLTCHVGDQKIVGTFLGLDDQGLLRLRHGDRELLLAAGEILER
jgi:BirA family biotin operon repressor/biotin-[acetyl-CoA-carboxylase] ligase